MNLYLVSFHLGGCVQDCCVRRKGGSKNIERTKLGHQYCSSVSCLGGKSCWGCPYKGRGKRSSSILPLRSCGWPSLLTLKAGKTLVLFYVLRGSTRYFVSSTSTSPKRDLLVTADIGLNMENIVAAVEGALLLSSRQ